MKIVVLITLLLSAVSARAQNCENTVRNWCYSQAIDPSRHCADLVARTCVRAQPPIPPSLVARLARQCREGRATHPLPGLTVLDDKE